MNGYRNSYIKYHKTNILNSSRFYMNKFTTNLKVIFSADSCGMEELMHILTYNKKIKENGIAFS